MRIITGLLKGRQISIPKTLNVRPTSGRTKEGMFSTIVSRKFLREAQVLDLFAGSGNLGFEALSRGADSVLFVDQEPKNITHIEHVSREFEVENQVRVATISVEHFLDGPAIPYDFIFADPPYQYPSMQELIDNILQGGWLQPTGWLVLEHSKRHDFNNQHQCILTKIYGRTVVSIFTPEPEQANI